MPKISNNDISVYHKDIRRNFKITVMYNQDHLFYAVIPSEFNEIINHLSGTECIELFIHKMYKAKNKNIIKDATFTPIVTAGSEGECLSLMKKCLEQMVNKSIVQRKVIILFYNAKDNCNYNEHRYNDAHPQIGMQFGLTYAIETSVGESKVYSTYREWEAFGEKRVDRTELRLYDGASTIIPDTPENRATLETLYNNLALLNSKIKDFTQTPETLLLFIESNIKLLN